MKGKRLPGDCETDGEVSDEDEAADIEQDGVKKKEKKNVSSKDVAFCAGCWLNL